MDEPLRPDSSLTPSQERLAAELRRLDPNLEGLYREGVGLSRRSNTPGISYLLAHAGRELSRGVIRALSEGRETLGAAGTAPDDERNRTTIASVVELPPTHGVVTDWFRAHVTFAENCHYQPTPAPPDVVASAFERLDGILFAVLAPYFHAKPELDRLLAVEHPSPEDLSSLKAILARRALRQRFFQDVSLPGWLPSLQEWGAFADPPGRQEMEDGSWYATQWVPGPYLVKVAAGAPETVTQILEQIPQTNTNPAVWGIAAQAALLLPVSHMRRVARLIRRAVNTAPLSVFGRDLIRLLIHAANQRMPEVFRLADTALAIDASEGRRRWLKHVEEFRLDDVFERLIPSLAAVNANEALELLIKKLRAVVQIDDEHGGYPGSTRSWCDRIDRDDSRKELPARLAHSVYARARQLAVDPASAVMICARLSAEQSEIFQRILIRLLADIGELVPEYVDRFIASDAALDPPFRATEVALVLRERFNVASDAARRVFVYALERGPNLDEVAWQLRHGVVGEQPVEKIDIETTVKEWQRTRLLWFQDRLPEQLQPLAGRVGVEPKTLSPQDQALAEIGVYIGPVSSFTRTDTSPKTLEELRAMGAEQLVTFLREWDPPAPSSPFGSAEPTVDGLSSVLTDLVSSESTMMEYLVTQGATVDLAPEYLRAIAKGVAKVVAANAEVPWASALKLVVTILTKAQKAIGNPPVIDQTTQPWVWASREALDLVKTAARANAVPAADSDTAWAALGVAIAIGARFDGETEITSSDELISAAVNRFSGEAVETVVEMALAERRRKGSEGPGSEFVTLLDGVVAANASPALAELGRLLPFVLYLTEAWVARSIAPLMADRDLMNPAECPFWAGYLLGQRFFTDTFTVLRPLYLSAAMQVDPSATPARRWSLTEHLAQHAILAMMHGVASGNDADHLLPTILDRVPIQDRKQANWLIYREVTDAGGSNTGVLVPRILAFWDWRLGCLEELDPTNPQRAEEAIGLTWLVLATRLPAVDALPLATRTIALSNGKLALDHEIWERAVEFSSVDPVMAFNFAKPIILAILQSDFVDLPASQISGILSAALHSGNSDTAAAATALIHHLGEHGCDVFGELLTAGKHDDVDG